MSKFTALEGVMASAELGRQIAGQVDSVSTFDELIRMVDFIIACGNDAEAAHAVEDKLHRHLIRTFCPDWVKIEIDRLNEADFPRWCA